MAKYCSYPGFQTGRDASRAKCKRLGVRQLSVFKVPKNMVQRWSRAIGECLSHTDFVCELHFSNNSIIKEDRIKMPDGTIEVIPHLCHTLIADAMPIAVHDKENGIQPEQNVPCDQLAGPSHGSVAICNDAVVHQVPTTCYDFLTPTELGTRTGGLFGLKPATSSVPVSTVSRNKALGGLDVSWSSKGLSHSSNSAPVAKKKLIPNELAQTIDSIKTAARFSRTQVSLTGRHRGQALGESPADGRLVGRVIQIRHSRAVTD